MIRILTLSILGILTAFSGTAQYGAVSFLKSGPVDVRIEYAYGNSLFSAQNNAPFPVFLHVHFKEVSKLSFFEKQPYVKYLKPGFNELFKLEKSRERGIPKYDYEIKYLPSNPLVIVNLDFPYLLPFVEETLAVATKVNSIDGFTTNCHVKDWWANGFYAKPKQAVCASRTGIVVEIVNLGDSVLPYEHCSNRITLLHADGTLASYLNVVSAEKKIKYDQKICAGELLGEIAPSSNDLIILFYKNKLFSNDLDFLIPKFQVNETIVKPLIYEKEYKVIHPISVRGLEMSKREKKKLLGKK